MNWIELLEKIGDTPADNIGQAIGMILGLIAIIFVVYIECM